MSPPGPKPMRRFPVEPLLERADCPNLVQLAHRLGVHRQQVAQYRSRGLSERQADRVAIALGFHPIEIWPDYWDDVLDEAAA